MAQAEALKELLRALKDRDVDLGDKDVRWAFESPQTRDTVVAWVKHNIRPERLLTQDELTLYKHIQSNPASRKVAANGSSAVKPTREDELETAITDLRGANDTIKAQTNILRRQIEKFEASTSAEEILQARQAHALSSRSRKLTQERQDLNFKIESEVEAIAAQLAALEQSQVSKNAEIRGLVSRTLRGDDESLTALPLSASHDSKQPNPQEQLYDLASKLQKSNETLIRNHLDRVYLETLLANLDDTDKDNAIDEASNMGGVSADLESLYAEISSVAAISVQANLLGPMLPLIQMQQGSSGTNELETIIASIDSLKLRLSKIQRHLKLQLASTEATKIFALAANTLLKEINAAEAEATSPTLLRRHSSSYGKSPIRPKRLRQNSFTQEDKDTHLATLTRQLGLGKMKTDSFVDSEKSVEADVNEMQRKLRQQLEVLESAAGDLFLVHVQEIDEVEQTLVSAFQSSAVDSKSLPQQLTEIIDRLQERLDTVAQGMGALQLEDRPADGYVDKDFVKKWAQKAS